MVRLYEKSALSGRKGFPPYSPATVANGSSGSLVFVSGQVALDLGSTSTELVGGGDALKEAAQCLKNVSLALTNAGSSLAKCCFVQIFLADIKHRGAVDVAFAKAFEGIDVPARAVYAVKKLPRNALVEMEAVGSTVEPKWATFSTPGMLFNPSVKAQNIVFVSGQLAFKDGKLSQTEGISGETKLVIENLKSVLENAGSSLDKVCKVTCLLSSMSIYQEVNKVYKVYFPDMPPARAAFAVGGLPFGANVMIHCTAYAGDIAERVASEGAGLVPVYSPSVSVPGIVFTSGQIALNPESKVKELVGRGDIGKETRQALSNLKRVLESANSSLEEVVKVNVFLCRMEDYAAVNGVYKEFFGTTNLPARSCVAVQGLPADALVEIQAVAL